MFSIKTYFLLLHTIQWTVPPYSVPSVSFQFYLLYFCTAVRFLCNCTGLFRLYFNECFLFFVLFVSQVLFLFLLCFSPYVFGGPYLLFIRFDLYECFSFVCFYYSMFFSFVNIFF